VSSSLIIGFGLLLGPVILVACIGIGLLGYSPEKAQAIREAEDHPPVVIEEIRSVRIRRPERFRHDRLDRHPTYLGLHLATQGYGWSVLSGAAITSNLASLPPASKFAMAACFLVGSTLVLCGAAMGARIGRWTFLSGIRDNIASSMLGDDIRLPYSFGAVGKFAIFVSMTIYGFTSFSSTTASLGGWMTSAFAFTSLILLVQFILRIRVYNQARALLIAQAVARLEHDVDN
jgi:hypothetical protein